MTDPLQQVAAAYATHKRAREAEELSSAIAVGHALLTLKAACPHGAYQQSVRRAGIPYSTAALFARLARHEAQIAISGVTSIREARAALTQSPAVETEAACAEDGSSVLALAKALGKSIAEAAEIEALVHGTDAESVVERYTSEAVAVSVATALAR
ncbi:MAG TPA: hypothetical protein VN880_02890 [Solirubrobacteraceae bacterium]|jgi:hypothetical protein|nr:hypothetical protein [Solirubrobacteraceae bacterium]